MTCCGCTNLRGALGAAGVANHGVVAEPCPLTLGALAPLPGISMVTLIEPEGALVLGSLADLMNPMTQSALIQRATTRWGRPGDAVGLLADTVAPGNWRGLCPFATYEVDHALARVMDIDARALGLNPPDRLDHWFTVVNDGIIVDPTWKQFLRGLPNGEGLPHILVGTMEEIQERLRGVDVGDLFAWYRTGIQALGDNPTYVCWP
jgi:hypothetical protein